MLAHTYYDEDPRVRREAEALVAGGRGVDVFALRRPRDASEDMVAGVHVVRLPVRRHQGAGFASYVAEYLAFFARAGLAAWRANRRRRYGLAQVHSLPDFLVFATLPLKLSGVPVLLDLHEAMPEFFRTRFPRVENPLVHMLMRAQERLAVAFADRVITANHAFADRLVALGAPAEKVGVVFNSPSLERFDPSRQPTRAFMADSILRLVYTGALTPTYELDVVLNGVAEVRARRPELAVELDMYGRGDSRSALEALAVKLGIGDRVRIHERIPLEEVPAAVARADVGLAPTRRDRFTDLTISTKIFEYAAMGKPVVASRLRTLERYLGPDTIVTYESGDWRDLAGALVHLVEDPAARSERVARTLITVRGLAWERQAEGYVALVERLARGRYPRATPAGAPPEATPAIIERHTPEEA
jgi:glycosyltransferase involved in cell wall biosynthesis